MWCSPPSHPTNGGAPILTGSGQQAPELLHERRKSAPQHAAQDVEIDPVIAVHHVTPHADDLAPLDCRELVAILVAVADGGARAVEHVRERLPGAVPHRRSSTPSRSITARIP